jgi:hypothetical protein
MNIPAPPPVSLASLRNLSSIEKKRTKRRATVPVATALLTAAGVLSWRLAPLLLRRRRRTLGGALWIAGGAAASAAASAGFMLWQLPRFFTPQPSYEVELRRGNFEVRRYAAMRIAATTVDKTWSEALNEGFRRLAGFIVGGNRAHAQLGMTTPVLGTGDGSGFHFAFVLPPGAPAPAPEDARVGLDEIPARRVAVLRFSGRHDASTIASHKGELTHALVTNGLTPRGEATFAAYDPPSTLPLLRRNELWVEIEPAPADVAADLPVPGENG